jgi:hypothetical protein
MPFLASTNPRPITVTEGGQPYHYGPRMASSVRPTSGARQHPRYACETARRWTRPGIEARRTSRLIVGKVGPDRGRGRYGRGSMRARLSVIGFVVVVGLGVLIPTAVGAAATAPTGSAQKHLSADQRKDRWRVAELHRRSRQPFCNQGQCVSYAIHHTVSLADLAGSLTGTLSAVFHGKGCSFLDLDGSVPLVLPPTPDPFPGLFTLTTNTGTLSGAATGQIINVLLPPSNVEPATAALALAATSGTGDFTGTTGHPGRQPSMAGARFPIVHRDCQP